MLFHFYWIKEPGELVRPIGCVDAICESEIAVLIKVPRIWSAKGVRGTR